MRFAGPALRAASLHETIAFEFEKVGANARLGQAKLGREVMHGRVAFAQKVQDFRSGSALLVHLISLAFLNKETN